jgi:class 3 adenylate cyclase
MSARCAACGHQNGAAGRFCEECGAALARQCPACAAEVSPTAKFCSACGAPLAARPGDAAVARQVVTIVFADLAGSTSLHERLDAESTRRVMDRYYRALHAAVAAHGGTVVKLLGDGVMAAFGVPRVGEDDALRAVRAALAMQAAFRELVGELGTALRDAGLRVAVNSGEVVVSSDHTDVVGDPVNVAARLQQVAGNGDVLIGESTQRLVGALITLEPLGELTLKGRAEAVDAYRVVSLERPAGAPAIAFVGREAELRRLAAVQSAAIAAPAARLAVVLGSPGLGKSRLLAECARTLAPATVLMVRCEAAGGATFAPLAAALRAHLGLDEQALEPALRDALAATLPAGEPDSARVAAALAALLAGTPPPAEETFFAVRRWLAALAAARPVLLEIDDLQWAAPLLLDLVEHLVQWGAGVPLFLLGAARPELRELRPGLASAGGVVSELVTLGGLDAAAAARLAASVAGADALPAAVAGRVLASSEGNPLFVGELVRMLVQDGTLARDGDAWTASADLAALEMPPTIHALLAARLDRLPLAQRTLLEHAAVIGRQFSRGALAHLLPDATDLDARLDALRRSELIELDVERFAGEPGLRFHHLLIRDAAYRRLLKETRAALHARVAAWLQDRSGDAADADETIGWHFEQAHQHLRELGALDAGGRGFGARAAQHLAAAGRRALARDDPARAATLLDRALERLDENDPATAALGLECCEALLAAGDVARASAAVDRLARAAGDDPRLRAWHACFAGQLAALTDPQALRATADAAAAAAQVLAAAGDAAGEAKAHSVHALALARLGAIGGSETALDRALAAARRAGDRRRANAVLAGAPLAALWGPSPVTRASGRCLDVVRVLRITQGAPAVEAVALRCQAVLEALRGRTEAARRMIATSRRLVEELGITQRLLEADVAAGLIEMVDGDATAAERHLRGASEGLRAHGFGIDAAQAAALLGRALLAQGRADEAEALSRDSEALAGDDLKAAIAWRGVRAEALARRGEHGDAIALARVAVELAASTDALLDHADARRALAVALRAGGHTADADAEDAHAVALWEAKGATVLADRFRGAVSRVAAAPTDLGITAAASRVCPNAATANITRQAVAMEAGDLTALTALLADDMVNLHHPTGVEYGRAAMVEGWRQALAAPGSGFALELLASLGTDLALCRARWSFGAVAPSGAGESEGELIALVEVDATNRRRRTELFAPAQLAAAVGRLYERHAEQLPAGAARERAAAIATAVAAILVLPGAPPIETLLAPDVDAVDHRLIGFGVGRGAEGLQRIHQVLSSLTVDLAVRIDAVLVLREDALLLQTVSSGTDRASGGRFERPLIQLRGFDAAGRVDRAEFFDTDRQAEALARFDACYGAASTAATFANAATRAVERFLAAWDARDWDRIEDCFAATHAFDDRRSLVRLQVAGSSFFASLRLVFDVGARWQATTLATRGGRLALYAVEVFGDVDGGAVSGALLWLVEVDGDGRRTRLIAFDSAARDAAYDALDDRYAADEAAPYAALLHNLRAYLRAAIEGDGGALAALLPADFTLVSHRQLVGTDVPVTRETYLATRGVLEDLRLRGALRIDHLLQLNRYAALGVATWHGTLAGGGAFEDVFAVVCAHDGTRFHRLELFDLDQLDAARACYDAAIASPAAEPAPLVTPPPRPSLSALPRNAATRAGERLREAIAANDWAAATAVFAPDFRLQDRRAFVHLDVDREQHVRFLQLVRQMTASRIDHIRLATRGERLVLMQSRFEGRDQSIGDSVIEWLVIVETNPTGAVQAQLMLDAGDLAEAMAELDARYLAGEGGACPSAALSMRFVHAFDRRDWSGLATLLAPDLEVRDHRVLGWETLHGPDAYVHALQSLAELSPDVRLRVDHLEIAPRGLLCVPVWVGTHEGGVFENASVFVTELDAQQRVCRFDGFDVEQLAEARRMYDALRATDEHG